MKTITVELASGVFQKLTIEDLVKHGALLFEYLCFLDISDLEEYIFRNLYQRTPKHNIGAMLRLVIAYYGNGNKGCIKLVKSLTDYDLLLLKQKKVPSGSRLQQFIQNQIGEENFVRIHTTISMTPAEKAGVISLYGFNNEYERLGELIRLH
ncbi:MAG: hypothetical protein KAH93_00450 [Candidatus Aenigmarchaeota archaeon]|nr:hypothetical protein [Candidatus Aenigmarchaeota archaeon]